MISIHCPHCGNPITVPVALGGQVGTCAKCQGLVPIPRAAGAPAAASPEPSPPTSPEPSPAPSPAAEAAEPARAAAPPAPAPPPASAPPASAPPASAPLPAAPLPPPPPPLPSAVEAERLRLEEERLRLERERLELERRMLAEAQAATRPKPQPPRTSGQLAAVKRTRRLDTRAVAPRSSVPAGLVAFGLAAGVVLLLGVAVIVSRPPPPPPTVGAAPAGAGLELAEEAPPAPSPPPRRVEPRPAVTPAPRREDPRREDPRREEPPPAAPSPEPSGEPAPIEEPAPSGEPAPRAEEGEEPDELDEWMAGLGGGAPPDAKPAKGPAKGPGEGPGERPGAAALPARARALVDAARDDLARGDAQAALRQLDQAIGLAPEYADAYCMRGVARERLGDAAGALVDYARAVELAPESAIARANYGSALLDAGQVEAAEAEFSAALEHEPRFALALHGRGQARERLGRTAEAAEDYAAALGAYPPDARERAWLRERLAALASGGPGAAPPVAKDERSEALAGEFLAPDCPPMRAKQIVEALGEGYAWDPAALAELLNSREGYQRWAAAPVGALEFRVLHAGYLRIDLEPRTADRLKGALSEEAHGPFATTILRRHFALAGGNAATLRKGWRTLEKARKARGARLRAKGRDLFNPRHTEFVTVRELGANTEIQPGGHVQAALPAELNDAGFALTVWVFVMDGSDARVAFRVADGGWWVEAHRGEWKTRSADQTTFTRPLRPFAWNAVTLVVIPDRSSGARNTRTVRITVNDEVLMNYGSLNGLLSGVRVEAGEVPVVVGAIAVQ